MSESEGKGHISTLLKPFATAAGSLDTATFLRLFEMRAAQVMWFLGAGASCAAGIPSAGDMIWDFKRKLFCSQRRIPASTVADIGDPAVRRRIQVHLDSQGCYPAADSEDEYSAYFEATFPSQRDRRAYIDAMVTTARPSLGHHALALLMREGLLRAVWTTNFDPLVESSAAAAYGSVGKLLVADLSEPEKAARALATERWPLLVKLHGDFQSERLMNTEIELRKQDEEMRRNLVAASRRSGLAVVGYSGRDASVMDALEEALDDGHGFPGGLFWFVRRGAPPFGRVARLIENAQARGIEARLVDLESFDELLGDVVRYLPRTAGKMASLPMLDRPRRTPAPILPPARRVPAIRLNALPILSAPTSCRLAECTIGGTKEVRAAIAVAGVEIDASRCRAGVIAFGRDADVRKAFEPFKLSTLDTYALSPRLLGPETQQLSLVSDALSRALRGRPGLRVLRRGAKRILVPDPAHASVEAFNAAERYSVDKLGGHVPGTSVKWAEACAVRIDRRLDRLWLVLEPQILVGIRPNTPTREADAARAFARERRAVRRNKATNSVLDGWISLIVGEGQSVRLRAFGISDGADADFEIARISAFSGRVR